MGLDTFHRLGKDWVAKETEKTRTQKSLQNAITKDKQEISSVQQEIKVIKQTLDLDQEEGEGMYTSFNNYIDVEVPQHFSPFDVIIPGKEGEQKKSDLRHFFPGVGSDKGKFHGNDPNGKRIHEHLKQITYAQNKILLSFQEFLHYFHNSFLGRAYDAVQEGINSHRTIRDIYFKLLTNYDMTPDPYKSKKKLQTFKAAKGITLPKLVGEINNLTNNASLTVPKGSGRKEIQEHSSVETLINCLPEASQYLVKRIQRELFQRKGRTPTFNEIIHKLYLDQEMIEADINKHGYNINKKGDGKKTIFQKGDKTKSFSTNAVMVPNQDKRKDKNKKDDKQGNKNYNNKGRIYYDGNTEQKPHTYEGKPYCNLCGLRSHTSLSTCRNMRDDKDRQVTVIPFCNHCNLCYPQCTKMKLYHPKAVCPYRQPHGIFFKKQKDHHDGENPQRNEK